MSRAVRAITHLLSATLMAIALVSAARPANSAEEIDQPMSPTTPVAFAELMEVSGVFTAARSATDTLVEHLRQENPIVPAEVWSRFAEKIADRDTLTALYGPIYSRHLSEEDARGIVAFYRTSTGQHLLEALPEIQQECREAAQAWALKVATDLSDPGKPPNRRKSAVTAPQGRNRTERARTDAVHELLRASGAIVQARQMMTLMIERLQHTPQAAELPASFWPAARARLTDEAALLELWTPAYAHHLSDTDIGGLMDFYRSPVGTRYVTALPAIQRESVEAGTQLANTAARRAIHEVLGPLPQWRLEHPQSASPPSAPPPP
jgi:hypothetical protein